jgi:hypothetical protein
MIVACGVWQRVSLSTEFFCTLFALLCTSALCWDLKGESCKAIGSIRLVIPPLLFVVSVFSIVWLLYRAWHTGMVTFFSIGPLLPYSDAGGYVNGAKSLITFGELGEWSARRPLGTSMIAAALWTTNQNYQWSLILLALATGVATFFAVRQTWLVGGLFAALVYLGLCALVLVKWTPVFMSERAGYIFAALSYALLLSAFRRRSFRESLAGIGLLVLAQAARPGAIFTIATIGAYSVYFFSTSWRQALRKGLTVPAVIAAALTLNLLFSLKIAPAEAKYEGSIAYTLYGLAAGGKSWDYVLTNHPEIYRLPSDGERSRYVYSLFRQRVIAQPGAFVLAIVQKFWFAISHSAFIYFGLVNGISPLIVAVSGLIGLILLVRLTIRRATEWAFLPPAAVGILSSGPFLFDPGVRVYMSTIPFHLALAVVPFALGVDWIRKKRSNDKRCVQHEYLGVAPVGEIAFAVGLTAAVTLIAVYISLAANPKAMSSALQKTGISADEGVFYFNRDSGILVEGESPPPDVLNVRLENVTRSGPFARDLKFSSCIFRGDFLCDALLLVHPTSHEDVIDSYIVFDRIPETQSGYLIVKLRLLVQKAGTALFKADDFRRLDL